MNIKIPYIYIYIYQRGGTNTYVNVQPQIMKEVEII